MSEVYNVNITQNSSAILQLLIEGTMVRHKQIFTIFCLCPRKISLNTLVLLPLLGSHFVHMWPYGCYLILFTYVR